MKKIIQIQEDNTVLIGLDDGGIKKVDITCLNFAPSIGDIVDIYQSEDTVVVTKINTIIQNTPNGTQSPSSVEISNVKYYPKKKVSKVAYVLFAFFLGGIGIHKFYAGKTTAGILYAVFCWTFVPAFISFVEFIIGLCATSDADGMIEV